MDLRGFLADGYLLCKINLKHYSKALTGIGTKLDPDYPVITRFFPTLIRDSVLEWRVYGGLPLIGLIVSAFPLWMVMSLLLFWMFQSISRARYFRTPLAFWKQAAKESPSKFRPLDRYQTELCREIQRLYQSNAPDAEIRALEREAFRVQDVILELLG